MAIVGVTREMKLHGAGDDSRMVAIIPMLLDPVIVAMGSTRMLFRRMEQQGDQNGPVFMQEWAVETFADPPAELANTSHRPI